MNELSIMLLLAVGLSGILLRLLTAKSKSSRTAALSSPMDRNQSIPTAKHYRYFPQIRQAISAADFKYLTETALPHVAKRALRERRAVARRFLEGLHEDFSNLARLGRIIAVLSPEVSHRQETERLVLSLKFQMLYALVWLRLSAGNLPLQQLEHLTGLVGMLAKRMDEAMSEINALSANPLPGGSGA